MDGTRNSSGESPKYRLRISDDLQPHAARVGDLAEIPGQAAPLFAEPQIPDKMALGPCAVLGSSEAGICDNAAYIGDAIKETLFPGQPSEWRSADDIAFLLEWWFARRSTVGLIAAFPGKHAVRAVARAQGLQWNYDEPDVEYSPLERQNITLGSRMLPLYDFAPLVYSERLASEACQLRTIDRSSRMCHFDLGKPRAVTVSRAVHLAVRGLDDDLTGPGECRALRELHDAEDVASIAPTLHLTRFDKHPEANGDDDPMGYTVVELLVTFHPDRRAVLRFAWTVSTFTGWSAVKPLHVLAFSQAGIIEPRLA